MEGYTPRQGHSVTGWVLLVLRQSLEARCLLAIEASAVALGREKLNDSTDCTELGPPQQGASSTPVLECPWEEGPSNTTRRKSVPLPTAPRWTQSSQVGQRPLTKGWPLGTPQ